MPVRRRSAQRRSAQKKSAQRRSAQRRSAQRRSAQRRSAQRRSAQRRSARRSVKKMSNRRASMNSRMKSTWNRRSQAGSSQDPRDYALNKGELIDWRVAFNKITVSRRKLQNDIRSIVTNPSVVSIEIPATTGWAGNKKMKVEYDKILVTHLTNSRLGMIQPGTITVYQWSPHPQSPYKNDLPTMPTVDQIVDYIFSRILNGTNKLSTDKLSNQRYDSYYANEISYVTSVRVGNGALGNFRHEFIVPDDTLRAIKLQ